MVRIEYNRGVRLGNRLYLYAAGRLLARRLGLAMAPAPLPGFPRTHDVIAGRVITSPFYDLAGNDPIPSWPDVGSLREKSLRLTRGFVNSRYFVGDRERIRNWFGGASSLQVDSEDVLVNVRLGDFLPGRYQPLGLVLDPSYYTFVLERLRFKKLYLMTDNPGHPYLKIFDKYNPIPVTGYGTEHFFKALAFKRIVMSNSTFCWWFTFVSSATEVYLPMMNGNRIGAWCVGHLTLGVDLRLDLPEVTHVYNIPNWGPSPCPPITDAQRVEAVAFSKHSKTLFLP